MGIARVADCEVTSFSWNRAKLLWRAVQDNDATASKTLFFRTNNAGMWARHSELRWSVGTHASNTLGHMRCNNERAGLRSQRLDATPRYLQVVAFGATCAG